MLPQLNKFYPSPKAMIFAIPALLLLFVMAFAYGDRGGQQFSYLSQSFIHGHLYFLHPIGGYGQDPVLYKGKIFWAEGPFPAVVLAPFVAVFSIFHRFFYQAYLDWFFVLGSLYFIYKLARSFKYSREDSLLLVFAFGLGSVFIGIAAFSSSWIFAQAITTFLLTASIYEYFTRKRWLLLGLLCGVILITRESAAPIFIFFGLELLFNSGLARSKKIRNLVLLVCPVVLALCLQLTYNYLRFHSFFNGGYVYQLADTASVASRQLGVFSIKHIPGNFYACFLSTPLKVLQNPDTWTLKFPYIKNNNLGLSIFITSPYLLYLFSKKWLSFDTRARNLLAAAFASCLLVLCFYGIGTEQFGYRYSMDFTPELFVVFMLIYKKHSDKLSRGMKILMLGSGIFNFCLLLTFMFPLGQR